MNQTEENFRRIQCYNLQESSHMRAERTVYLLDALTMAVRDSKGTWRTINGTHVKIDEATNKITAGPPALKGKNPKKIRSDIPGNPKNGEHILKEYSNEDVTVVQEPDIDYNDDRAIEERFQQFCKEYKNSKVEHALVVTTTGKVYRLDGKSYIVDITVLEDMLREAKVIHNHPDDEYSYGDCFSKRDFGLFCRTSILSLDVTSGLGRYRLKYSGPPLSEEEAWRLYDEAYGEIFHNAILTGKEIEHEQLEVMTQLSRTLRGLSLQRCKK